MFERDVREETANVLETLGPDEETVIRMRFGIGYDREHKLEEIAQQFNLTRERIRQIESTCYPTAAEREFAPAAAAHHDDEYSVVCLGFRCVVGTPGKIRTYDLLLRRQTLYPD